MPCQSHLEVLVLLIRKTSMVQSCVVCILADFNIGVIHYDCFDFSNIPNHYG